MKKPIIALIYDFDKTLATTDMQNFGFIPKLSLTPAEFWGATNQFIKDSKVEKILAYMYVMIMECKKAGIPLTKNFLKECGDDVEFFPGVEKWFKRINQYGKSKGVKIEHYLCSSGNVEIIKGTSIYKEFKKTFGCEFYFSPETKEALWPKNAVNYTQKTQYIFRIAKGALDINDDDKINDKTTKKKIPYSNMIYFGDGVTDVPSMEIIKNGGGHAIAIGKDKDATLKKLVADRRVQYVSKPNYTENSNLDKIVKTIINYISVSNSLSNLQTNEEKNTNK